MINFPSSLDTYTAVDGTTLLSSGHAAAHNAVGSIAIALETAMGTTAGTNVLKNFAAGDFPARINSSNVLQQAISGTVNLSLLNSPMIGTAIYDTNGNEVIKTPATASAVNEITVTNAATGGNPLISATGGDDNINLKLLSKGTGRTYISGNYDGWIEDTDTWVYASASTFTIAGKDLRDKFGKGTKLKFSQTSVKYAVVTAVAFSTNTTVTIAVNTDYVIANATITSPYYSYEASPQGYPGYFTYAPTWGGFSADPSNGYIRFSVIGRLCFVEIQPTSSGTSNATSLTVTMPITIVGSPTIVTGIPTDNGSNLNTPVRLDLSNGTTNSTVYSSPNGGGWTGSAGKRIQVSFFYDI